MKNAQSKSVFLSFSLFQFSVECKHKCCVCVVYNDFIFLHSIFMHSIHLYGVSFFCRFVLVSNLYDLRNSYKFIYNRFIEMGGLLALNMQWSIVKRQHCCVGTPTIYPIHGDRGKQYISKAMKIVNSTPP